MLDASNILLYKYNIMNDNSNILPSGGPARANWIPNRPTRITPRNPDTPAVFPGWGPRLRP
jgi:hypothetical protein